MSTSVQAAPAASLPRLNEPAPEFEALTTHGTVRLTDFRGSWLVFFSHPADFTPVCTTEFAAFAEAAPRLRAKGVELLGLSIDSLSSHLAWVRNIRERLGVEIPFPIIADGDRAIAGAYGMVMPGESRTETSRCVFVIDPVGMLRAMIFYPLTTGRNVREIERVVEALQTTDRYQVATPANWEPGQHVIVPAPRTIEDIGRRLEEGFECVDWYLCYRSPEGAVRAQAARPAADAAFRPVAR